MPKRTPLNAVIHGKLDCGDHTVEKVYFESMPGFFVTGSLYRPKGKEGRMPGVLSAHGHWSDGRFHDAGLKAVRREIAIGAERFEEGGRSPLQARCVQLARMGCVVFHYDMMGYADSVQIGSELVHGFARQRPEMNVETDWGLFSPPAEARYQSVMGLQTWNSIRALDFLVELPDVDAERIGVTGASGGGTQTFVLCAVDGRPAVAFPAVMVSTAMQGGCTCENTSGLRVGTGNVEIAALFAPKPLGLTSANDWTREMSTKGFPELQRLYGMYGEPDRVTLERGEQFGHNYNALSRAAMYRWFNRHLKLGLQEPDAERDYRRLSKEELTVWDEGHPRPEGGEEFERRLLRWWTEDADAQLQAMLGAPDEFRRAVGESVEVMIGRRFDETGPTAWRSGGVEDRGDYREEKGLLRSVRHGEELPVVVLTPRLWKRRTAVWVDRAGKEGLYELRQDAGRRMLKPEIIRLLEGGVEVVGVDLLYQGEFLLGEEALTKTRRVENPREAAGYTFGYNHSLFAQRVHDVLTVTRFLMDRESASARLHVVGLDGAGPWVIAARAVAGGKIDRIAVDTGGFRFGKVLDPGDVNFLPGGAKFMDLPGLIAMGAPGRLWLAGEGPLAPKVVETVYTFMKAEDRVKTSDAPGSERAMEAVAWILEED
jgi:dienelactone hydrolase